MTDSPDLTLMQEIRSRWQATIAAAVAGTSIPEAFLAGLVANESDGNPDAKRFEHEVLAHLWEVLLGRKTHFGAITTAQLKNYVAAMPTTPVTSPVLIPANAFQRLDELATSFGLTQIMGYHILEWISIPGWYRAVDDLRVPESNLRCATLLLTQFANEFSLDLGKDFSALLHCWNDGSPTGTTFDPAYVPNAIRRMDLYSSLAS